MLMRKASSCSVWAGGMRSNKRAPNILFRSATSVLFLSVWLMIWEGEEDHGGGFACNENTYQDTKLIRTPHLSGHLTRTQMLAHQSKQPKNLLQESSVVVWQLLQLGSQHRHRTSALRQLTHGLRGRDALWHSH